MKRMILPAYMASTAYQLRNLPSECSLGKSRSVEDSTKGSFRLGLEICPPRGSPLLAKLRLLLFTILPAAKRNS
jgi:hypothetical protein